MQIQLSAELQQYVDEQVRGGRYASPAAVVEQALIVLRNVENVQSAAEDDLRREIALGLKDIEAGRVSERNVEDTKRKLVESLRGKKAS